MRVRRHSPPVRSVGSARLVVVLSAAVGTTLVLLGTTAPAALAHDELVTASPGPDSTVPFPPESVELGFSGPIQQLGSQVLVTGPDGDTASAGEVEIHDATVVQPLADGLASGTYRVHWRATSSDGHPLSGAYEFTATAGAATTPEVAAQDAVDREVADVTDVDEAAGDGPTTASLPVGRLALGALVVLAVAGLAARRRA